MYVDTGFPALHKKAHKLVMSGPDYCGPSPNKNGSLFNGEGGGCTPQTILGVSVLIEIQYRMDQDQLGS